MTAMQVGPFDVSYLRGAKLAVTLDNLSTRSTISKYRLMIKDPPDSSGFSAALLGVSARSQHFLATKGCY